MTEYLVIYEDAGPNWAAHVPDLPGWIGVGKTKSYREQNVAEGVAAYIKYLIDEGQAVPVAASIAGYIKAA